MAALSFTVTRNDIAPTLSKLAATAKNPTPVFRAMGTTFKSITEGNFNSVGAAFRPKPWPAKKDGTPSSLKKSGTLSSSFHLEVTPTFAKVKNPSIYAARHQFGDRGFKAGKKVGSVTNNFSRRRLTQDVLAGSQGTPPRPYFPVDANGKMTPAAETLVARAGERAVLRESGAG